MKDDSNTLLETYSYSGQLSESGSKTFSVWEAEASLPNILKRAMEWRGRRGIPCRHVQGVFQ